MRARDFLIIRISVWCAAKVHSRENYDTSRPILVGSFAQLDLVAGDIECERFSPVCALKWDSNGPTVTWIGVNSVIGFQFLHLKKRVSISLCKDYVGHGG